MSADRLFGPWVRANFLGWLLGLVFVIAGGIGAGVLLRLEGAQFYLGIGMGAGIGYAQMRVAAPLFGATSRWGWACVLGMAVPFMLSDIVRAVWRGLEYLPALYLNVAAGGLLVGVLQRRALPALSAWWIPASGLGWTLAAGTVAFYGFSGGWEAAISLGAMVLGGVVLGVVTGGSLVWMRRVPPTV